MATLPIRLPSEYTLVRGNFEYDLQPVMWFQPHVFRRSEVMYGKIDRMSTMQPNVFHCTFKVRTGFLANEVTVWPSREIEYKILLTRQQCMEGMQYFDRRYTEELGSNFYTDETRVPIMGNPIACQMETNTQIFIRIEGQVEYRIQHSNYTQYSYLICHQDISRYFILNREEVENGLRTYIDYTEQCRECLNI